MKVTPFWNVNHHSWTTIVVFQFFIFIILIFFSLFINSIRLIFIFAVLISSFISMFTPDYLNIISFFSHVTTAKYILLQVSSVFMVFTRQLLLNFLLHMSLFDIHNNTTSITIDLHFLLYKRIYITFFDQLIFYFHIYTYVYLSTILGFSYNFLSLH